MEKNKDKKTQETSEELSKRLLKENENKIKGMEFIHNDSVNLNGEKLGNDEQDLDSIRAEWEETKIELKNAKEGLKTLSNSLNEAVRAGADKEVVNGILDQWTGYNDKVTELEKKMIQIGRDGGRPDPFSKFVDKSRENFEKGTKILGNKVNEVKEKFTKGKSGDPKSLTAAILAEHNKVDAVYHEEQSKAAKTLSEDLDKYEVKDVSRIDAWIDAIEASEKFESRAEPKRAGVEAKAQTSIESVKSRAEIEKTILHKKYEDKAERIKSGDFTRGERMQGGFQTILDAVKNSPLKDYFGTPKTPSSIEDELKKARKEMEFKEKGIDKLASVKTSFVKAWAGVQNKVEEFRAGVAKHRAQRAEKMLDKIKNPRAKNILDEIKRATEEGKTLNEARNNIKKDIGKVGKDAPKNDDRGPGDR